MKIKQLSLLGTFGLLSLFIGFNAQAVTGDQSTDTAQAIEATDHKNRIYILNRVTAEQANFGFFHASIPVGGVVTVALDGADKFKSSKGAGTGTGISIDLEGNTAFIKVGFEGQASVGLGTVCGTSISVLIDTHPSKTKKPAAELLNKVAVQSPLACNPDKKEN